MNGILLVDKPLGWTSFDAVNYVRRIIALSLGVKPLKVKVGHTGTLDPSATGLLVLCIGSATKQAGMLTKQDKVYEAEIKFGFVSSTGDVEGEITASSEDTVLDRSSVERAMSTFRGEIEQTPPQFSALKVNGKRAYDLARQGKPVTLQPRLVTISELDVTDFEWPIARIRCRVSSGTYIRTLAEDIGASLGVGAYLTGLRRTSVGEWSVASALQLQDLTVEVIEENILA